MNITEAAAKIELENSDNSLNQLFYITTNNEFFGRGFYEESKEGIAGGTEKNQNCQSWANICNCKLKVQC